MEFICRKLAGALSKNASMCITLDPEPPKKHWRAEHISSRFCPTVVEQAGQS